MPVRMHHDAFGGSSADAVDEFVLGPLAQIDEFQLGADRLQRAGQLHRLFLRGRQADDQFGAGALDRIGQVQPVVEPVIRPLFLHDHIDARTLEIARGEIGDLPLRSRVDHFLAEQARGNRVGKEVVGMHDGGGLRPRPAGIQVLEDAGDVLAGIFRRTDLEIEEVF